jgi:CheY-like chemotaxis protein
MDAWNVLVVDDEEDVHNITKIALRRRTWKERPIDLTSAKTSVAARNILTSPHAPRFHCVLVDVVMESNDAGLRLCDFIRTSIPQTTRIVLRTGQAGAAPPERVMNEYDIDYYLAKTEVTEERLFTTLRACFRSSLDIAALLALGSQLRAFTVALQDISATHRTLAEIMRESLRFIEEKYSVKLEFVPDRADAETAPASTGDVPAAVHGALESGLSSMVLHPGPTVGLGSDAFLVLAPALATVNRVPQSAGEKVKDWLLSAFADPDDVERGAGILVTFEREPPAKIKKEFLLDLELFVSNWRLAESSIRIQERLVKERAIQMRYMQGRF